MIQTIGVRPSGTSLPYTYIPVLSRGNGFYISNITGVDPAKSSIPLSPYANINASVVGTPTTDSRNMVLTIDLDPDFSKGETYESIRDRVYGLLSPNNRYRFLIEYDNSTRSRFIEGYVESNEIEYFSQSQIMTVSIVCPKPYFVSQSTITLTHTANSGVYKLSTVPSAQTRFGVKLNGPLVNPSFETATGTITYNGTVGENDTLQISTLDGAKTVTFSPGGSNPVRVYGRTTGTINQYLGPGQSDWFRVYSTNTDSKPSVTLSYIPLWIGA